MALRKATPLNFSPHGLSDTLDGTNTPKGMMASLQNLIPDPTTTNLWQCRPASQQLVNFNTGVGPFSSGWSSGFEHGLFPGTNGFISCLFVFGNFAYGMISTTAFPGNDAPFAYNLVTNTFTLITGITAANTPTSPATTGDWSPPTMALVGSIIVVTHPGFNGAGNGFIGWITITNLNAPTWNSGNITGTVTLAAPPTWVEQFNGRAYYLINPSNQQPVAVYSDSLSPLTTSGATLSVLTFGDNQTLTAADGLPLQNQLGGIIQSLIVFKGVSNIYQVTGDVTTNNLSINSLNVATGTLAPNAITSTPLGLMFVAPDGLRLIDFFARVSDPIGVDGAGINIAFIFAVHPSRINANCNFNVMRISVQNGNVVNSPQQEYWFDISRKKWSGPHTFPPSMIAAYQNTFIIAPFAVQASLWRSDVVQSSSSSFVENGQTLTWNWQTSMLPDSGQMSEYCMIETTLKLALSSSAGQINVFAENENGAILNQVSIKAAAGAATIWGQFNWGQANWGSPVSALFPQQLGWNAPVVFQRLAISAQGVSGAGVKIGDLQLRYQKLGYLGAAPLVAA